MVLESSGSQMFALEEDSRNPDSCSMPGMSLFRVLCVKQDYMNVCTMNANTTLGSQWFLTRIYMFNISPR